MIVTEAEASKKACVDSPKRAVDRWLEGRYIEVEYPCIGSRCMAWVWMTDGIVKSVKVPSPPFGVGLVDESWIEKHRPEGEGWAWESDGETVLWVLRDPAKRRGTCGKLRRY